MFNSSDAPFFHKAVTISQSIPKMLNESVHQNCQKLEMQRPMVKQIVPTTPRKSFGSSGNCNEVNGSPSHSLVSTPPKACFQLETPSPGNELLNNAENWRSFSIGNNSHPPESGFTRPGSAGSLGMLSFGAGRKRQVFNFPSSHPTQKSHDRLWATMTWNANKHLCCKLILSNWFVSCSLTETICSSYFCINFPVLKLNKSTQK